MRSWLALVLFAMSGCATFPDAHLVSLRARLSVQRADTSCGPVAFRRAALGARWGEYLKVTVSAPGPVSGEARLYVDRRPGPPVRFDTSPWTMSQPTPEGAPLPTWPAWSALPETPLLASAQQAVVVDVAWPNEQLDVESALPKSAPLELSVSGLASATGSCAGVTFTVEQGVLQPTIGEGAWVAELTRRGGPEWQAKLDAEARRKDEIRRAQVALVDARREAERATLAERTAIALELRQRHYAQWAERREARFALEAEVQLAGALDVNAGGEVQLESGAQRNDVVAAGGEVELASGSQRNDVVAAGAQLNDGAAWGGGWTVDPACAGATCGVLRASDNASFAWSSGAAGNTACSSATCGVLRPQGNEGFASSGGATANIACSGATCDALPAQGNDGFAWSGTAATNTACSSASCGVLRAQGNEDFAWNVGATCGAPLASGAPASGGAWTGGASCSTATSGEVATAGGAWAADTAYAGGTAGVLSASGEVAISGGGWAADLTGSGETASVVGPSGELVTRGGAWAADSAHSGEVSSAGGPWAAGTACSGGTMGVVSPSGDAFIAGGAWAADSACSAGTTGVVSASGEVFTTGGAWAAGTACSGGTMGVVSPSGERFTGGGSWAAGTARSGGAAGVVGPSVDGSASSERDLAPGGGAVVVDAALALPGDWPGMACLRAASGAANLARASELLLDASWLVSWPTATATVSTESDGWALPSGFQRVAVSTTTELVPPPLVDAHVTVEAQATASVVEPWLGFVSAVLTGLVQAAPPPQPVHRAAPAKR